MQQSEVLDTIGVWTLKTLLLLQPAERVLQTFSFIYKFKLVENIVDISKYSSIMKYLKNK